MSEEKKELNPEEEKALSRKRVFFGVVIIDVVLAILILWAIVELFVG
ncbi:MAG: hypothetical protein LKG11_05080 [Bacilli bacterium]|jgi:hypothetical protein|nr:hypothetical protein [Bacilli bacterium]